MSTVLGNAYPTAERVDNLARAIINDTFNNGAGRILTDANKATFEYLNSAIEYVQDELGNHGIPTFTKEIILTPILPVAVSDPTVYPSISYTGYFDGKNTHTTPVIPQDLLVPWRLWERQTGSNAPFHEMGRPEDGLPSYRQDFKLRQWEWRGDSIFLLGATQTNDIRLRYEARLPFVTQPTDIIPIKGVTNILAQLLAYKYAKARGAVQAADLMADANKMIQQICNRNARMNQRRRYRRQAWGGNNGDWGIGGTV
jgi:hypothetical protein